MKISAFFLCFIFLCSCTDKDSIYTLYRNSPEFPEMRIHVASFDVDEKEEYNRQNCFIARDLFAGQLGVEVKYWCEKGRYRS